jgi:CMP-N,N'-diacetyllegionaminic acid synthase
MTDKEVLCSICARGGSQGVKNKNLREILGKPLIAYTIEQALESGISEQVAVSTDSDEIATVAQQFGADVFFKRPSEMASSTAAKVPVIRHMLLESEKHYGRTFDVHVDLDATAPLRQVEDIRGALSYFLEHDFDNLVTGMPARRSPYFNLVELNMDGKTVSLSKKPNKLIVRRQDAPACFDLNSSIWIWKREALLQNDPIILDNTGLFEMPHERSIDVDSAVDFAFVEFMMERQNGN